MALARRPAAPSARLTRARTGADLVALWLRGRPAETQRAYRRDAEAFLAFVARPLAAVTLEDLHDYRDTLRRFEPATRARRISAVKSLLSFAHRAGLLAVNVGAAVQPARAKDRLAERILAEPDVHRLIALEPDARNRVLLRLLYASGARVSELCGLTWADVQPNGDAGQVTLYGKGGKTRTVLLSAATWRELAGFRGAAPDSAPVFPSPRTGKALSDRQVRNIVRAAAVRAGIAKPVSPHWLRHAHGSHALDRGATVATVRDTLGHASISTTNRYVHARPRDSSARYLTV